MSSLGGDFYRVKEDKTLTVNDVYNNRRKITENSLVLPAKTILTKYTEEMQPLYSCTVNGIRYNEIGLYEKDKNSGSIEEIDSNGQLIITPDKPTGGRRKRRTNKKKTKRRKSKKTKRRFRRKN